MPLSKPLLKPCLSDISHSLFTIVKAMSSYGTPALNRIVNVSVVPFGSKKNYGVLVLSAKSG